MGATVTPDEKYTNYPKNVTKSNEELEAMFEAQRKARENQPPIESAPVEEPVETPVETPVEEPMVSKTELDKSDQRYRTLEGKYNTEIGEFRRQNAFLYQTVQNLQREIEGLKSSEEKKTVKVSLRENLKMQALKGELAPEVYENLVGAMEETLEARERAFEEKTEKLRGEFSTTLTKSKDDIFWDAVYEVYPMDQYNQLGNDPKFQEFLGQSEGLSGLTRGVFLINAYNKRDSRTYVRYLNAFKKENEGAPPSPEDRPNIDPNNPKVKNKIAAPRSSGSEGTDRTPKPVTQEMRNQAGVELEKITAEFGRGLWNGREKDFDKKQAALIGIINSG